MRLSDLNLKENDQIVFWCKNGETLEKDILLNGDDLRYLPNIEIFEPEDNSYKDQKRIDVIVSINDYQKILNYQKFGFSQMRDSTKEERDSINRYLDKISKNLTTQLKD